MVEERAVVKSVEPDFLWVETVQQSSCNSCNARDNGCGQGALSKWFSRSFFLKIPLEYGSSEPVKEGDNVIIAVPDNALTQASLLAYLIPLLCLIGGAALGQGWSDLWAVVGAFTGLLVSAALLMFYSRSQKGNSIYQPRLLSVIRH